MYRDLITIVASYTANPRDVHTVPIHRQTSQKWFHVSIKDGFIYVEAAHSHQPASNISIPRKLDPQEFDDMLSLYHQRQCGKAISAEATERTRNQVYWYGIFSDLNL